MIEFNGELLRLVREGPLPVVYEYNATSPDSFVVIDAEGQLQEIGHAINPWLRLVGWAGQYWAFQKDLKSSGVFAPSSISLPIVSEMHFQGETVADLSSFHPLSEGGPWKL